MARYSSRDTNPEKYQGLEFDPDEAIRARIRAASHQTDPTTGHVRPSTTNEMYTESVHGGAGREVQGRERPARPYSDLASAGAEHEQHRAFIVARLRRALPANIPPVMRRTWTFTEEEVDAAMDVYRERQADGSDDEEESVKRGLVKPRGGDRKPGPGEGKGGDGMGGGGMGGGGGFGGGFGGGRMVMA